MRLEVRAGTAKRERQKRGLPLAAAIAALALAWLPVAASAQNDNPLTPVPPREVRTISRESRPAVAPVPPEEIIRALAAHADEYLRAHSMYGFKRSIRLQEFLPGGDKGGDMRQESEVYLAENGRRYEKSTKEGGQRFLDTRSSSVDVQKAATVPLFLLTTNQLPYYDLTYKGAQPLDELNTYIFEVKPKKLLNRLRLFSGIIYVDDQDLAIVKTYGTWKSAEEQGADDTSDTEVPFSLYEMYYENVSGKYWFPTYIRSEAYVHTKNGDEQLRLTVRMMDFKVAAPAATPGGAASPSPAPPAIPPKPDANAPKKPLA